MNGAEGCERPDDGPNERPDDGPHIWREQARARSRARARRRATVMLLLTVLAVVLTALGAFAVPMLTTT